MNSPRLASWLATAAILLAAGTAAAQTGSGGSTTATWNANDFQILIQDPPNTTIADVDLATSKHGFNLARCQCKSPFTIRTILTAAGQAKAGNITSSMTVKIGVGSGCDLSTSGFFNASTCTELDEQPMTQLRTNGINVDTNATVLVTGAEDVSACATKDTSGTVGIFVGVFSSAAGGNPDFVAARNITIDVKAPDAPDVAPLRGGQEALVVDWTKIDQAAVGDLLGYQLFCIRGADLQVFKNSGGDLSHFGDLDYLSPRMLDGGLCNATPRDPLSPVTLADIEALDPAIACSNTVSVSTSSYRIQGLQNGIPYAVAVAAVDKFGNASPIVGAFQQGVPVVTRDFWTGYQDSAESSASPDDRAEGGFCSVGTGAGTGAGVMLALGGLALAAARRRRPRR